MIAMANLDNCTDATYLPTTALVFGEMSLAPLSQSGNLDIYPENPVSYMCAFSPTVKELNSMFYIFEDNVVTIDGAYFGNVTLIN